MGKRRARGVAMMDVALAAVRGALGVGHVLAEQLIGSGPEEQMGGEVAMQQRDHVAAGPQRHDMPIAVASLPTPMVTVPLT